MRPRSEVLAVAERELAAVLHCESQLDQALLGPSKVGSGATQRAMHRRAVQLVVLANPALRPRDLDELWYARRRISALFVEEELHERAVQRLQLCGRARFILESADAAESILLKPTVEATFTHPNGLTVRARVPAASGAPEPELEGGPRGSVSATSAHRRACQRHGRRFDERPAGIRTVARWMDREVGFMDIAAHHDERVGRAGLARPRAVATDHARLTIRERAFVDGIYEDPIDVATDDEGHVRVARACDALHVCPGRRFRRFASPLPGARARSGQAQSVPSMARRGGAGRAMGRGTQHRAPWPRRAGRSRTLGRWRLASRRRCSCVMVPWSLSSSATAGPRVFGVSARSRMDAVRQRQLSEPPVRAPWQPSRAVRDDRGRALANGRQGARLSRCDPGCCVSARHGGRIWRGRKASPRSRTREHRCALTADA
jgi:hypothetical protein